MTRPSLVPVLACLVALAAAAPCRADDVAPLKGAAAWQKLVGNTVVARTSTGASYTDYYAADGTVRHQDGDGSADGQWRADGDAVCFDYPDDDDRFCVQVTVAGATGTFADAGGATDTFTILPGNARHL